MDVIIKNITQKKIKIFLVFFCVVFLLGCVKKDNLVIKQLYNKSNDVIGIQFPKSKQATEYKVFLKGSEIPILGTFTKEENNLVFRPVIPFTPNNTYEIFKETVLISEFTIATALNKTTPVIREIYPTTTTVPENLLKMYFVFSEPMQEVGSILDYVVITNKNENLEKDVFLKLESELWNKEHTMLTLWLDPGRIKTDLIPNKEKGLPIRDGNTYVLTVKKEFKSAKGIPIAKDYTKSFEVVKRDAQKPKITDWELKLPTRNTSEELVINLNESLDAILLLETVSIRHKDKIIIGSFQLSNNETKLHFKPKKNWEVGSYKIEVLSILEDLAGNNLNRLFDNNLNSISDSDATTPTKSILFTVE